MIEKPGFIVEFVESLPRKKMKKASKVNKVLQSLYDAVQLGQIAKFDPGKAGVNPASLRSQLRTNVKSGLFSPKTRILSRSKEWFFERGT